MECSRLLEGQNCIGGDDRGTESSARKARKELGNQKRTVWAFSPTTKKVESKKLYNRKKSAHAWKDDFGMSVFCFV